MCWGGNQYGQLGNGQGGGGTDYSVAPVAVAGLDIGVASVGAGTTHTCALMNTGHVKCWGDNSYGQLGNGKGPGSKIPVEVLGLEDITSVSVGEGHTCALRSSGGVKCWGWNEYAQIGSLGTEMCSLSIIQIPCVTTPTDVFGLQAQVAAIGAGVTHSCAVLMSGSVKCWGRNYDGQLGDGTTLDSPLPSAVVGLLSSAMSISLGQDHTCALMDDGTVACWGRGGSGQLGDGTGSTSYVPVVAQGLVGMAAISAGYDHTCALSGTGNLKCWGFNFFGELGDGRACGTQCLTPANVSAPPGYWAQVEGGRQHTCAVTSSGAAMCWGSGLFGRVGNSTAGETIVPVPVLVPKPTAMPTPSPTETATPTLTLTPTTPLPTTPAPVGGLSLDPPSGSSAGPGGGLLAGVIGVTAAMAVLGGAALNARRRSHL